MDRRRFKSNYYSKQINWLCLISLSGNFLNIFKLALITNSSIAITSYYYWNPPVRHNTAKILYYWQSANCRIVYAANHLPNWYLNNCFIIKINYQILWFKSYYIDIYAISIWSAFQIFALFYSHGFACYSAYWIYILSQRALSCK